MQAWVGQDDMGIMNHRKQFMDKRSRFKERIKGMAGRFQTFLILCVVGLIASLLLGFYTELSEFVPDRVSWGFFSFCSVLIVEVAGFALIGAVSFLVRELENQVYGWNRLFLYYLSVGLCLVLLNYVLFVSIKWLGGVSTPFVVKSEGLRMICLVWLLEMLVLGQMLMLRYLSYVEQVKKEHRKLVEENQRTRYQALQSQLNPHFLFNSLNTLVAEIAYDPDNAITFTRELSEVYRYVLRNQQSETVLLRDELDFVRSYLFLQRVRLGNCLTLEEHISPRAMESGIPPLALQVLVENVLKHNQIDDTFPMSILISDLDEEHCLIVSNPIHAKQVSMDSEKKGLRNLEARYRLLCGKAIGIDRKDGMFTVKIPLL